QPAPTFVSARTYHGRPAVPLSGDGSAWRRGGVLDHRAAVAAADQDDAEQQARGGEGGADEEGVLEAVGEGLGDRGWIAGGLGGGERLVADRVGHRREDREPEGAADLLGGVDEARGEA